MGTRHVIGNRGMAAPVGRTGMARDPLTLVEDLDRLVSDAHIDEFTDQPIRGGIPMAVDLDVIVGRDAAALPASKDVGLVRQLSQLEPVDLGEQFGPAGAETRPCTRPGSHNTPPAGLKVASNPPIRGAWRMTTTRLAQTSTPPT